MNADTLRSYRFATEAQWSSCLFDRADRGSPQARTGMRPFAPYARPAALHETPGAHAPAVTRAGEILWRDDAGSGYRLPAGDDEPESFPAPFAVARAGRLVATPGGLWVAGDPPDSLQRYETDTLARLLTVELQEVRVVDLAGDGRDGIFALVTRDGVWRSVHVNRAGQIVGTVTFEGLARATAFTFLRGPGRFVVLAEEHQQRLHWFPIEGGAAELRLAVAALHPCFTAVALGGDSRGRVFLAGADGESFGGAAYVLSLDGEGNPLGDVPLDPLDTPATGIAASRDSLLVTGPRGLLRFTAAETVPDGAGEVRCTLVTPMLHSPDREDARRWLRIEALGSLPQGATLEISFAATDDPAVRDRLAAIAADAALTPSRRVRNLHDEPDLWRPPTVFHGGDPRPGASAAPLSAPLFDVRERYLWASVTLIAAPGARLPSLSQLAVMYPGRTLMENLPAIYQRAEAEPGNFLRALVGVLEATTQDLDARIAAMSRHVHPLTAPEPWLDFVARWLGVPWDDALSGEQKRAVLTRAAELARSRGTRAGLEALLESLLPGSPRRFRVIDATADYGFAIVGDAACAGSALPAIVGGFTRWSAELDSRAVLGSMRLPCPGQLDDGAWQLAGRVRIDVAATAEERRAWEPWLLALILEMAPITVRVDLRWVAAHGLRGDRLDGTLTLESAPAAHLGTDAVTGLALLPERGARLSESGPLTGTRLH